MLRRVVIASVVFCARGEHAFTKLQSVWPIDIVLRDIAHCHSETQPRNNEISEQTIERAYRLNCRPSLSPMCEMYFAAGTIILAFTLSCLCHAKLNTHDDVDSYDLLSWLQRPHDSRRSDSISNRIVLSEDQPLQGQAGFLETLDSMQDEHTFTRNDRSSLPEYGHLCETVRRKVELSNDPNYEYQPPHYFEDFCKSYSLAGSRKSEPAAKQKCAHPSFHCIQRSRTLFLLKRRWGGECWEPTTRLIASGCDCMWPTSNLGDVAIHY